MKPGRFANRLGAPISVQIIGLLVVVLIIGQLSTFAAIVVLPPPRPPLYRLEEIAAALKGEQVTPPFGPRLLRSTAPSPPQRRSETPPDFAALRSELARELGAPPDQVRLIIDPSPFPFAHHEPPKPNPGAPPDDMHGGPSPWGNGPPPPYHHDLVIGTVEAAYRSTPGQWTIVRSAPGPLLNPWQMQILLCFLAGLAVLVPAGYVFGCRLTAPIVRFAQAAEALGRDPRGPPIILGGPAEIGAAAAAFNEMQGRLARYVEDRTAMIAAIAHDLRTPLARIQFKLQRAPVRIAAEIGDEVGQIETMVADVLAFVRDGAVSQRRVRLDLLSVLEVVVDDAAGMGADATLEPGPSAIVEGDAAGLRRLFSNLADNAVKYGGSARIRLEVQGSEARVEIIDRGPGLEPKEWERVFEPFYRVEGSRSRETGGIGLGLAVARSIARAHGGDVTLRSGPTGVVVLVPLPGALSKGCPPQRIGAEEKVSESASAALQTTDVQSPGAG